MDINYNHNRKNREAIFMEMAFLLSKRATCSRLQVAVLITTPDNRIISSGYNGPLKGEHHCSPETCNADLPCTRAMHAEANAIAAAAAEGISLKGSIMWCTHHPCVKCAELIISAGIATVNYGLQYRDNSGLTLLLRHGVNINLIQPDEVPNKI